jgi:hypothetical protein
VTALAAPAAAQEAAGTTEQAVREAVQAATPDPLVLFAVAAVGGFAGATVATGIWNWQRGSRRPNPGPAGGAGGHPPRGSAPPAGGGAPGGQPNQAGGLQDQPLRDDPGGQQGQPEGPGSGGTGDPGEGGPLGGSEGNRQ